MFVVVLATVLISSFISGILGMAGGMILIGVMSLTLPIASAMILHGFTQMGSNSFRAFLLRKHIRFEVLPAYLFGSALSLLVFTTFSFLPSKGVVLISVGLFPFLAILSPKSLEIDILKNRYGFMSGLIVTAAQILAGASGPLVDAFFINSQMNRHEIIATKAITQTVGHLAKLLYYGRLLYFSQSENLDIPLILIPASIGISFIGTRGGKVVLDRLSELQFQSWSRIAISIIGFAYILKGVSFLHFNWPN